MTTGRLAIVGVVMALVSTTATFGDVFNMGEGLTSLQCVTVGNPGNAGELSGLHSGGYYGPDRICGSVSYTFNIGKYEVTAGQYTDFLNKVAGVDTYGLYNTSMWSSGYGCKIERFAGVGTQGNPYQYRVAADYANRPVNYVSWGDSARFSNWLQNGQPTGVQNTSTTEDGAYYLNGATTDAQLRAVSRKPDWMWAITSEDEWYKAAYHKNNGVTGDYFDYPTSSNTAPGNDMADASGNNANYYTGSGTYPIDSGKYTTVVGEFQNSDSPYGTFDQGGNVWEWNEALIATPGNRALRGTSFYESYGYVGYAGYMSALFRDAFNPPSFEYYGIGFRVSEVPEPATVVMLALGGLAVLRRRKRMSSRPSWERAKR